MPLHVAASVQRVGIGPRRPVRHQSIFCERASARGTTLSPRLLKARFGALVLVAEKWNVFERVSVMNVFRAPLI